MFTIAQYLTSQLIKNQIIEQEDQEVYSYGLQLVLSSMFITVFIVIIGFVLNKGIEAIVFLMALAGLRHYAGGYHANAYEKCFLLSCSCFIATVGMIWIQNQYQLSYSLIVISLVAMLYLFKVGSLNSIKNPKTDEEMAYRSKRTRLLAVLYSLISCFLLASGKYVNIGTIIVCTQVYTALAVWIIEYEKGKRK
ncbi:MAG: accessory gene regulator B family protein [Cellulosilyticum sp.]|nr:accessory gene regulator B family protein [Cellulosilyticum sp.]MEE1071139.1 accessory gene regulator B family protein [Cellulosilyticum sp.]